MLQLHAVVAVTSGPRPHEPLGSAALASSAASSAELLDTARLAADMEARATAVKVVLIAELWRRQVGTLTTLESVFYELFARDRSEWHVKIASLRLENSPAPFEAWLAHEPRTT